MPNTQVFELDCLNGSHRLRMNECEEWEHRDGGNCIVGIKTSSHLFPLLTFPNLTDLHLERKRS